MKSWNTLFIRQGFAVREYAENEFDLVHETEENIEFLMECLQKAGADFTRQHFFLTIHSEPVTEKEWLAATDFPHRGYGEGLWFDAEKEEPKISELDLYISGLVRQLNRLKLFTMGSCDGNGIRYASIHFRPGVSMDKAAKLFSIISDKKVRVRNQRLILPHSREELLELAEKALNIDAAMLELETEEIEKQLFFDQLEELLNISGESGNEGKIRKHAEKILAPLVDHLTYDSKGNILAQKRYRGGNGPTILLNAHLDTLVPFDPDRIIVKEKNIWTSSSGILGADDRAGVAVLLQMAKNLEKSSFRGTVKFILTVEEEIGLVGAQHVDEYFLWDVDAAIVLDRRGTGDIVISCGGYIPFCDDRYGQFIESTAIKAGLSNWKCTNGGSSDTRIWAAHGIQSVNLSVGYLNEHTSDEKLDVEGCYDTVKFVEAIFERARELRRDLTRRDRNKLHFAN
ncbi:M20/M25/M40 family metallo-hydrolase [Cytobacillus firmus]|uniref:M20/M25/M40 family metallo-hydrolase n=1 Tax=Cytobacillus firmus TaxID=1399 RepID=UPI0021C9896C|nr:M20/M25/M40 family metallo-hydrolase [Cytobacillus firmus]MCU1806386.1 M20/M25/M40 family metallo-hydrolase [Cytobacillus firmus]